jgi:phosphoglycolate phosphatase-like HAD superfamily hydrolase
MKQVLVMFDWDGTLADSVRWSYRGVCAIFRHWGVAPPSCDIFFEKVTSDIISVYHRHGIPKNVTREELNAVWNKHLQENLDGFMLREGARDVLQFCHQNGMKTAIVSANTEAVITRGIERFGIGLLIDHVTWGAYDKARKLKEVRERFGAERAFYVDDTHEGITAAKSAGVIAIAITGGFELLSNIALAEPDHTICALGELFTIFHRELHRETTATIGSRS